MLWTPVVHILDPWTQICCLHTLLKTKKTPVGCTTLEPHQISTSLYADPDGYIKQG